jgi:hypothetical protein
MKAENLPGSDNLGEGLSIIHVPAGHDDIEEIKRLIAPEDADEFNSYFTMTNGTGGYLQIFGAHKGFAVQNTDEVHPLLPRFVNHDGLVVEAREMQTHLIALAKERGYTNEVMVRGKVPATELAMHMKICHCHGVAALINGDPQDANYGFVILDNGKVVEGGLRIEESGHFWLF